MPARFFIERGGPKLHFFDKCDHYQFFHLCTAPSLDLYAGKLFLVAHCRLHLTCLQNQHKNTQSSRERKRERESERERGEREHQALGSFTADRGWEGWRWWGPRVHPITDSNEVKYSLADGGRRQWNGGVQLCTEPPHPHLLSCYHPPSPHPPPRYPAKCANQNLVYLINTSGLQIALLGNWWRLGGCIKGQGRGGTDKREGGR